MTAALPPSEARPSKTVLITGAAGNLGGFLARHLAGGDLRLRLMEHRTPVGDDLRAQPNVEVVTADLADPQTLGPACQGVDVIVHFAGVLFAPGPQDFLHTTNTVWAGNLMDAAAEAGVGRFIICSFPHVEGPTTPEHPATGRMDGDPVSVHAQTRLAAERQMFEVCKGCGMEPVALRVGMVYARGVLMPDNARSLRAQGLLGVWRQPTWIHLISLVDFLRATEAAIGKEGVNGVYNVGDEHPTTLQEFLDRASIHWKLPRPWRAPAFLFFWAAWFVELYARIFSTAAPITRDFIRIGMVPYVMDTTRMRQELLPELTFPTLDEGIVEL